MWKLKMECYPTEIDILSIMDHDKKNGVSGTHYIKHEKTYTYIDIYV